MVERFYKNSFIEAVGFVADVLLNGVGGRFHEPTRADLIDGMQINMAFGGLVYNRDAAAVCLWRDADRKLARDRVKTARDSYHQLNSNVSRALEVVLNG